MPQKYAHCIDCKKPKITYSQQLSPRCNVCSGKQKRKAPNEAYYTHCVDCGELRPLEKRRYPRCRQCAYDHLRKNEYFEICQKCREPKSRTKSRLCRSCSLEERFADYDSIVKTYSSCQECGTEKADTRIPICKPCSMSKYMQESGRAFRTIYTVCQGCDQPKSATDRELCLSCAGIKRMTELFGTEDKEYPMGWCDTLKERIRDRDDRKCQLCGKTKKENGRKLDVHHIDEDKHNLNPKNLISLCASCHGKTKWNHNFYYQVFTKYRHRQPKQDWQRRVVVTANERRSSLAVCP